MIPKIICFLFGHQKFAKPETWRATKRGHCPRCGVSLGD
jgi:hypothetical protein